MRRVDVGSICVGGYMPPQEENTDLPEFTTDREHLLLKGFYGYKPRNNDRSYYSRFPKLDSYEIILNDIPF